MTCKGCIHIQVCGKYVTTGGLVHDCKHFVEQKHGRWIIHSSGRGKYANNWVECSECRVCGSPNWKVCPVCETKMDMPNITENTMDALMRIGEKVHEGED